MISSPQWILNMCVKREEQRETEQLYGWFAVSVKRRSGCDQLIQVHVCTGREREHNRVKVQPLQSDSSEAEGGKLQTWGTMSVHLFLFKYLCYNSCFCEEKKNCDDDDDDEMCASSAVCQIPVQPKICCCCCFHSVNRRIDSQTQSEWVQMQKHV